MELNKILCLKMLFVLLSVFPSGWPWHIKTATRDVKSYEFNNFNLLSVKVLFYISKGNKKNHKIQQTNYIVHITHSLKLFFFAGKLYIT